MGVQLYQLYVPFRPVHKRWETLFERTGYGLWAKNGEGSRWVPRCCKTFEARRDMRGMLVVKDVHD